VEYRGGRCGGIGEEGVEYKGGRVWNTGKKGVEYKGGGVRRKDVEYGEEGCGVPGKCTTDQQQNSSAHAPKNYARSDCHCIRTLGKISPPLRQDTGQEYTCAVLCYKLSQ